MRWVPTACSDDDGLLSLTSHSIVTVSISVFFPSRKSLYGRAILEVPSLTDDDDRGLLRFDFGATKHSNVSRPGLGLESFGVNIFVNISVRGQTAIVGYEHGIKECIQLPDIDVQY